MKQKLLWGMIYAGVFIVVFAISVLLKLKQDPTHGKYRVNWNEDVGAVYADLTYGPGDANKFDLYLPAGERRSRYGLVVYLHAGGFTAGDKAGDSEMLKWLCSKGYVAAGINYTLHGEQNPGASVYSQSMEIREAIPVVIDAAAQRGYAIDQMAIAGGSAGHALAMIYAYRDGEQSPVPVVLTFGAVGPAGFHREDWGIYGLDESDEACAGLFSVMSGGQITPEEVADGSYLEKVKPISAADWIDENSPATVVAYGAHDKLQPYAASLRLKAALEKYGVDHMYFAFPHSGHGLQNDHAVYRRWMEAVEAYLDRCMPLQQK